ncbi:MAG: hypothetical protein ACN4GM_17015 [Gammaproteobacteria bacterium]
MVLFDHSGIEQLLDLYSNKHELAKLQARLSAILANADNACADSFLDLYQQAIPVIEQELWAGNVKSLQLDLYHSMFQQMEQMLASRKYDERHNFIVVVPVADRPQHLNSCLESLLRLCENFNYGGFNSQTYNKVRVLIADDSKYEDNIQAHQKIAQQATLKGLHTDYFGQQEQIDQIKKLTAEDRNHLSQILGDIEFSAFYHKGASIMRNITYLKLNEMSRDSDRLLFYFIDSDQEFRVKSRSIQGEQDVYAINYFYHLDQIFSNNDISLLTGKVVGDPPVSPAVMAGNFLEDVTGFLQQMSEINPQDSCQFHNYSRNNLGDASYHDMAELFGFKTATESYTYHCTIEAKHNHSQCFCDFSEKLNRFFYGEHPTRKSYYQHENLKDSIRPARTVYTGNYIFKRRALSYFIPFATLRLRMAGPVLGRIIKSEIADSFVSANLPMLHKRTVDDIGQSEFRPGVNKKQSVIDLSEEFERQFYGDVMLFTMEKLLELGYLRENISDELINTCLFDIEQSLYQKYETKHRQILHKLATLVAIFNDAAYWWNKSSDLGSCRANFSQFIANIEHNFGEYSKAYELVMQTSNRDMRNQQILAEIKTYAEDRSNWNKWVLAKDE